MLIFELIQTKYKFIFFILLNLGISKAFSQRSDKTNPFSYAGIYNLSPLDLKEFVNAFYFDFYVNNPAYRNKDFVKLSLETYDALNTRIYFKHIQENQKKEDTNTLALALGMFDNCRVQIQIDKKNWLEADNVRRLWVIYHELAHDIFNIKHGEGGPLMAPSIPPFIDETLFIQAKDQLMQIVSKNNSSFKCKKDFTELDSILN